jgi:hypothetical protein
MNRPPDAVLAHAVTATLPLDELGIHGELKTTRIKANGNDNKYRPLSERIPRD